MERIELKGKRVAVIGLGIRTGVSLVRYLCSSGALVTAYDQKKRAELQDSLNAVEGLRFDLDIGCPNPSQLVSRELVLLSPGVSAHSPYLQDARRKGIPILSEVEFAYRLLKSPLIAVTGTNGKSTTTALIAHILKVWGKNVFAGGNLGTPLIQAVDKEYDFVVAEISSFHLEAVESFHPSIAVLLNIFPNHLDRHGDMETYVQCKSRIFSNFQGEDRAVLNEDDPTCKKILSSIRSKAWTFSLNPWSDAQVRLQGRKVILSTGESLTITGFSLLGRHNLENALAACAVSHALGCPPQIIEQGITTFKALPHRLQHVARIDHVDFINDSKSTTPESTAVALKALDTPIILLAGGRSKGASYKGLGDVANKCVRTTILFGEAAMEMAKDFKGSRHETVETLADGFLRATQIAEQGDTILLSPANSSFDQFENFEKRGEAFAKLVHEHKTNRGVKP